MKKQIILLTLLLFSMFSFAQEDTEKGVLEQKIQDILETHNFELGNKLINDSTTKEILGDKAFARYCFRLVAIDSLANDSQRTAIEESILQQSKDSVFQMQYCYFYIEEEKYDLLLNFIDKLQNKYPQNKNIYLRQKGSIYLVQDEYLKAEPIYEELISIDPKNAFAFMDIGYYSMKYAEKIYTNDDKNDDKMPKNKKDAMPYFDKAIRNMVMAYKLFTDDQRCETYVLVFLNDLIGILVEDNVITNEDIIKYIDGVDFSTYHCD